MSRHWYDDPEPIHLWFSLSYANYLVLPRSALQSMPQEWQARFCGLLDEAREAFGHLDWPAYAVNARGEDGRFSRDPIPHYNRGRTKLTPRARRQAVLPESSQKLDRAERALWDIFLIAGADPSPYCHETRSPAGRRAGFEEWRKRTNAYGEILDAVQTLRDDSELA